MRGIDIVPRVVRLRSFADGRQVIDVRDPARARPTPAGGRFSCLGRGIFPAFTSSSNVFGERFTIRGGGITVDEPRRKRRWKGDLPRGHQSSSLHWALGPAKQPKRTLFAFRENRGPMN